MKLFAVLRRFAPVPILLVATLVGVVAGLASIGLLIVIDQTTNRGPNTPTHLAWRFAGLVVLVSASRFSSSIILARLGARAATILQVQLARRIVAAPLRRLEEVGTPRLMASLVDDVTEVSHTLTSLPNSLINTVVVIASLCYMGYLSLRMLGAVLCVMMVGVLTYRFAVAAGAARQRQAREREDELFDLLRGVTQGTKELKMRRSRSERFVARLDDVATTLRGLRVQAQVFFVGAASWGHALFFLAVGVVLYSSADLLHLSPQTRSGYIFILLYMIGPLQAVLNTIPDLSAAEISVRKIERLGISLLEEEAEEMASSLSTPPAWRRLELDHVTHTYRREDGDVFTLGPLDLTFEPGQIVFFIGGNGSGKTTLVKLLLGLYPPEKGEIRWNGEKLVHADLDRYRRMFSVVFSDFYLFEELFGLEAPDLDDRARLYLAELRLKHKVRIEGGRLSTTELSQGQRKRLALLTAYLEEAPIFVFDEWAADQDPEFKAVFYRELLPDLKARGKTMFVISHDDRYYSVADRIVKLDSGQLVYDGLAHPAEYAGRESGLAAGAGHGSPRERA
ncbi:MAG: putative pyoverdin transport system ATP-binding/permease protein [Acidobacteriota bacterium]|jgi:putative ATP-binding cassette transporter|nr:putative pyoverdin transport system ATP-binding/permease protein [Acidobacteriota bacterium]